MDDFPALPSTAGEHERARYLQIAESLEQQVRGLPANVLLPTEERLAKQHGVSRVTIRRALDLVERSGLIRREQGRGTLVSPPKLVRHLVPARAIERDFADQGLKLQTTIIGLELLTEGAAPVRQMLRLGARTSVAQLSLLRSIDDEALVFERRFFAGQIAKKLDLEGIGVVPISALVAKAADVAIRQSDMETEISPCGFEVAEKLRISVGTFVAVQRYRELVAKNQVLECGEMFYRTDRIRFSIQQSGAPF